MSHLIHFSISQFTSSISEVFDLRLKCPLEFIVVLLLEYISKSKSDVRLKLLSENTTIPLSLIKL